VIDDQTLADRLVALFLNTADVQSQASIIVKYERSFDRSEADKKQIGRIIHNMIKDGIVVEHDVENDTLDGVIIDHSEHGQLDNKDITFLSVDDILAIGPEMVNYTRARASQVAEQAISGGLQGAIKSLKNLPIDSNLWTGMPVGFKLDAKTKAQVVSLLYRAEREISAATVNNREASQAKALVAAALILTEAPEPESEIVWGLLQKLSVFVTLSQGIEGLIKLFKAS